MTSNGKNWSKARACWLVFGIWCRWGSKEGGQRQGPSKKGATTVCLKNKDEISLPSCVDASGMFPPLKVSYDSGLEPLDSCHLKGWFQDGLQASVSQRLNTLVYSPIMRSKSLFLVFRFVLFVVKEMFELFYVENFQVVTILQKTLCFVVILNTSYCNYNWWI